MANVESWTGKQDNAGYVLMTINKKKNDTSVI